MMTTAITRFGALAAARTIAADIKLAHSVFALPFAILAAFMAAAPERAAFNFREFAGQAVLIVLAMVAARTVAMLSNRLLDRAIDGANPRTAGRALPSRRLSVRAAMAALLICAAAFMLICMAFGALFGNWWPAWLAAPVLAWISAYPLFKRFTSLCHLYLGSSLALSPIAAAIAVEPAALANQPALWLLALVVLCWVAGFDIIYALQDVEVDRAQGLHSMPARWSVPGAMWISRWLHALAAASLVVMAAIDPRLGAIFAGAVALVVGLLIYEHLTVARWGTTRLALAFFTLNGLISLALGIAGSVDVLMT